ncbi:MAG: hypothetical protein IPK70_14810 [Flavobacteriales bacterium]|jgi:hypothetical protein|nr:hypothetical protein [Flavobacteriales bacterium]
MPARYLTHVLIALLALLCAQAWNRISIGAMADSPARANVRDGRALISTDDASYLQGVDRLLGARPDLEQAPEAHRPSLRAPGYSLFYLLPRLVLDPLPAISALVWMQCLLYAFAVAMLWDTLVRGGIDGRIRWPLILALAMMPTFHGFLFHTFTEGITPSLSVLLLCCAFRACLPRQDRHATHRRWLFAGLALWSLIMFTRPALLWTGLALLPGLLRTGWLRASTFALLALAPLLGWWLMNVVRAEALVGLHPLYSASAAGIERPTHGAFWDLAKSWGTRGDAFHPVMEDAFAAALLCDTSATHAERFLRLAPPGMLSSEQSVGIERAFLRWQRFTCAQLAPALGTPEGTIRSITREEQGILFDLEAITREWRRAHRWHHHVVVPLRVLKQMIAHSNLNLWAFQHTWRGQPLMEALRWSSAILHAALLAAASLAFLVRVPLPVRLLSFGCAAYLFYLAYAQRGVEERYTLPVLFIGVVCAAFVFQGRSSRSAGANSPTLLP